MKKRLMAVLLCVCMAAVLLTPYAGVLTADGALLLGVAGADGSLTEGGDDAVLTEGGESGKATDPAPTTVQSAPQEEQPAPQQEQPEPQAEGAPQTEGEAKQPEETKAEQPAQTEKAPESEGEAKQPEETKAEQPAQTEKPAEKPALPKYVWDSEKDVVWKDGSEKLALKDYVVRANWTALAYKGPTDSSSAKTYATGARVRVYDEIKYDDRDGIERKWSVVLDGSDFYFVLSEALESAPELPAQAPAQTPAQTDMKSLFGGGDNVDPARIINPDQPVATYNFYIGTTPVQSEKIKDGESLKEPEAPATVEGQTFEGWYTAAEGGEKFTSFGTALTVTETTTISLYARFKAAYHIYFYMADGSSVKFTKDVASRGPHDFSDLSYEVGADIKVTGWAATLGGNEDVSDRIVIPEGETSVDVYAIETKGYWVVFDTQGGTSVAPVFKAENEELVLSTVTAPTRTGYTFDGWYGNKECTGDKVTTVSAAMTLDAKTTLYAKWTAQTAKLTVVFWYENANDGGYGLAGTLETTAVPETVKNSADYKEANFNGKVPAEHKHFTYNAAKAETVTVEGDGSTVLNVYYTRNKYTLKFQVWEGGPFGIIVSWKTVKTIIAKYDAKISDEFNKAPFTTTYNGRAWKSDKYSYALQTLDRMPGFNTTFELYPQSTSTKKTITYYVQKIGTTVSPNAWPNNPDNFDFLKKVDTYFKFATYDEEYHEILGFTRYSASVAGFDKDNRKNFSNNKLDLYYMRNSYDLKFYNHNAFATGGGKVQYEAPLSGYDFVPDYPTGLEENIYEFKGWYTTPNCYEDSKADLTKMTMPANDVTLYAKWAPKMFTVSFNLGYEGATGAPESRTVKAKEKATQPADPTREGYRFVGWYDGDKPFSFETEIVKDTALTAKWLLEGSVINVKYNLNGGGGTAPTDGTLYADGAGAVVKGKGEMTAPAGKEFFLGWATDKDATTADYLPGGTMTIDANMANENRVITLYAVWGDKPATTTLTYNANYGENPATVLHKLEDGTSDGTTALPNNTRVKLYTAEQANFTPPSPGYVLDGWNTNKDEATAGVKEYDLGATVYVDTNTTAGANILYAVWKQLTTTVTVKKVVTGNFADKTKAFAFQYKKAGEETWTDGSSLSDGGSFTIDNVTPGSTLLIREMPEGYTANVGSNVTDAGEGHLTFTTAEGYCTATITGVVANETITFTNHKEQTPDTGVILDSLPYVLILAVVALGAAGVVIRRRRSREDD